MRHPDLCNSGHRKASVETKRGWRSHLSNEMTVASSLWQRLEWFNLYAMAKVFGSLKRCTGVWVRRGNRINKRGHRIVLQWLDAWYNINVNFLYLPPSISCVFFLRSYEYLWRGAQRVWSFISAMPVLEIFFPMRWDGACDLVIKNP